MLHYLKVRNLAIIESLEVELGSGLNIVSGETGAGKSIIVDALELVMGGRGDPSMVRAGCESAEIEAIFAHNENLNALFDEWGVEINDDIIVRRIITTGTSARSRAFLNGQVVTLTQLSQATSGMLDISSQHAYHKLVDTSTHLFYLDAFAGLAEERTHMREAYALYRRAAEHLANALEQGERRKEREELIRFQWQELSQIDPKLDEEDTLNDERTRLRHAELLARAAGDGEALLYSGENAIDEKLAITAKKLEEAVVHDAQLKDACELIITAQTQLREAARMLGHYLEHTNFDGSRLESIEERLSQLHGLKRKYGGSMQAVIDKYTTLKEEVEGLEQGSGSIDELQATRDKARKAALEVATRLSKARLTHAKRLAQSISHELHDLGMGNAVVEVSVQTPQDDSAIDAMMGEHGTDKVEFLIAPNPGEPVKALQKIASGGELSRSLLAIKKVLSSFGPKSTLVFDEVDTGVGGAMASAIGKKVAQVAQHHQVVCITHLPQIAAFANRHYVVSKHVVKSRTQSQVVALISDTEVIDELARMLGGLRVSDATRAAAHDVLTEARELRDSLKPASGQPVNDGNGHKTRARPTQKRGRTRNTTERA